MNGQYAEIIAAMGEPKWWNEAAAPRYVEFSPRETANIYAVEAALVLIECQGCEREFKVCFSRSRYERAMSARTLSSFIRGRDLHYGDPPNIGCCPAGPTMNSVPRRVLEYWHDCDLEWKRDRELEVEISPEWAES